MHPYIDLPDLSALYLEDSYVLGIDEADAEPRFHLDAVLTETHPDWTAPRADEQYCYRRLDLVFPNLRAVDWLKRTMKPFRDATGEVDLGNIDTFVWEQDVYELSGDWGHIKVGRTRQWSRRRSSLRGHSGTLAQARSRERD